MARGRIHVTPFMLCDSRKLPKPQSLSFLTCQTL